MTPEQRAAMEQGLEALKNFARFQSMMMDGPDVSDKMLAEDYAETGFKQMVIAITAMTAVLADDALNKMAENERELGIQMQPAQQVGCEGEDGLLRIHAESETCDVCEPAQQEPVAWRRREKGSIDWQYFGWKETAMSHELVARWNNGEFECEAIPKARPQAREWVGLTESEIIMCSSMSVLRFYDAIEAKLREKNT